MSGVATKPSSGRASEPVVIRLPLTELSVGGRQLTRLRSLSRDDVRPLLHVGLNTAMIVADVGAPLRTLAGDEMRAFWREEAADRIGPPEGRARLEDFPGNHLYWASQWGPTEDDRAVILLEKEH